MNIQIDEKDKPVNIMVHNAVAWKRNYRVIQKTDDVIYDGINKPFPITGYRLDPDNDNVDIYAGQYVIPSRLMEDKTRFSLWYDDKYIKMSFTGVDDVFSFADEIPIYTSITLKNVPGERYDLQFYQSEYFYDGRTYQIIFRKR